MCKGSTQTSTSTSTPNPQALAAYQDVVGKAQSVASTPYQPYTGELVAGLNTGQQAAIGQLQSAYGLANPFYSAGSGYLNNAASGLNATQPYLQLGSNAVQAGQGYQGQAAGLANPNATAQYMNPYTSSVIDATMAQARQNDAVQSQQLASGAIGSGAFGGDRAGIAQATLAGQQDLANNQTVAGLNQANYAQATAARQADAGLYGNLANSANQSAGLYNSLGSTQGQVAANFGTLAGLSGNLGTAAQNAAIQGASAGLQGSTLQQQNQQQQDTALYNQYMQGISYPFQTTGWLSNIVQGVGSQYGNSTSSTSPGPSYLSQAVGLGTTGLGVLGATGAFGTSGYLTGAGGLLSSLNRGGRVDGYARGGLVPRKHFLDGGDVGLTDPLGQVGISAPQSATASTPPAGLNFSPTGLTAPSTGSIVANQQPVRQAAPMRSAQPQGLGIVSAAPQNNAPVLPSGLAGGSGSADNSSGSGGLSRNAWLGVAAAGMGMMAGTSPFAMANIGAGGLAGVKQFESLQNADRQNAIAQSEIASRQAALALDTRKQDFTEKQAQRLMDAAREASAALSGQTGAAVGAPPSTAGQPAASASSSPVSAPTQGQTSLAPATTPAAPAAASGNNAAFWSGVQPNSNPVALNAQADRFQAAGSRMMAGGNTEAATQMFNQASTFRAQASKIYENGTVVRNDGSVASIPGAMDALAAKKAAETQGQQAGETKTVYDPDGNPVAVSGSTYQNIVKNGGGSIDGLPVSATQSQYAGVNVDNYKDFSKNAIKFQEDYQQNRYALNALNQIYQKYQAGHGAEAIGDLDGFVKRLPGSDSWLPPDWQNSQSGFDAALKGAVDQAFRNMADSGATKAPATGLRESLLTSARPDADPAAVQKILTDKLAALDYSHDLYNTVINGSDHNVSRAVQAFQNNTKYSDYIGAARGTMPLAKGVTPSSANMVLGSPSGQMPSGEQSAVDRPTVGQLYSQARDAIARGAPKAAVLQRLQQQYKISGDGL